MTLRDTASLVVFAFATFVGAFIFFALIFFAHFLTAGGGVITLAILGFIAAQHRPKKNALFIMIFLGAAFFTIIGAYEDAYAHAYGYEPSGVLRVLADAWIPGAVVTVLATFGFIATYGGDRRDAVPMTVGTIGAFGFVLVMAIAFGAEFGS